MGVITLQTPNKVALMPKGVDASTNLLLIIYLHRYMKKKPRDLILSVSLIQSSPNATKKWKTSNLVITPSLRLISID